MYLQIKGITLQESADPTIRAAGRRLLERQLAEYPNDFHSPYTHELLGNFLRSEGDSAQAEFHYRECMRTAPPNRSGTSGLFDLSLAEMLLDGNDSMRNQEISELLDSAHEEIAGRPWDYSTLYKFQKACAQLAHRQGDEQAARDHAQEAIRLSEITDPPLARHPTIGLVQASAEDLESLRAIVNPGQATSESSTRRTGFRARFRKQN